MSVRRKRITNPQLAKAPLVVEHTGFYAYLLRYLDAMRLRNYSARTLTARDSNLRRFIVWCDDRGLEEPQAITKPIVERYQRYLYHYRKPNGEPLGVSTRNHYINDVKQFFKWLTRENYLLYNPASEIVLAKQAVTLPDVLSVEEVEHLLQQPDTTTASGIRDRTILEVFYSTGIRRTELINLAVGDLSLHRKTLFVRQGKGGKDRLLPIGERALVWIDRYLAEVRSTLVIDRDEQTLFLSDYGEAFGITNLGNKVKRYLESADIHVTGSCHLLRHAMATHMLENGADMRYLQAMLGHSDVRATQIYTHVSIRKLQEIHHATHPAKLRESTAPES